MESVFRSVDSHVCRRDGVKIAVGDGSSLSVFTANPFSHERNSVSPGSVPASRCSRGHARAEGPTPRQRHTKAHSCQLFDWDHHEALIAREYVRGASIPSAAAMQRRMLGRRQRARRAGLRRTDHTNGPQVTWTADSRLVATTLTRRHATEGRACRGLWSLSPGCEPRNDGAGPKGISWRR